MQGLLKPFLFAIVIALVGCYYGIRTSGGTQGVGRATTKAVVVSSVWIFVITSLLDPLFVNLSSSLCRTNLDAKSANDEPPQTARPPVVRYEDVSLLRGNTRAGTFSFSMKGGKPVWCWARPAAARPLLKTAVGW